MGIASSVKRNVVKKFEKDDIRAKKIKEDFERTINNLDTEVTCLKQIEIFLNCKYENEKRNIEECRFSSIEECLNVLKYKSNTKQQLTLYYIH